MLFGLLAKLPLGLLYALARLIYFITYYVVRYRRGVVFEHLRTAFPERSEAELRTLAKSYYRNLADVLVEVIRANEISATELDQRVVHKNFELLDELVAQGRSIIFLSSHSGNWEWLQLSVGLRLPIPMDGVYKPLHNKAMDRFIFGMRTRFGSSLIDVDNFMAEVVKNKRQQRAYAVLADQKPKGSGRFHTTQFLNRETRFFIGPEKIAQFAKAAVVFVRMTRKSRGYYEAEYELIAEPPYMKDDKKYPITELYARAVESHINANPDSWLWSNRRWRVRNHNKKVA